MPTLSFDSATLPPAEEDLPQVLDLTLAEMKCGLLKQVYMIRDAFIVMIARGLATNEGMNEHLSVLLTVIDALDRADMGEDIRRSYPIRKPTAADMAAFAPRATPTKTPEQIKALSAPAPAPRRSSEPRPFDDPLPENLRPPEPHDLA